MRILLHTMATPELEPIEAFDLARRIGLDGIEMICQSGYRCGIAADASIATAAALGAAAADRGVPVAVLSAYTKRIANPDQTVRLEAIAALERSLDLAAATGAKSMRVLAGEEDVSDVQWAGALARLTDSLRILSEHAQSCGVTLLLENHMDTMASSASKTVAICRAVNRENVAILMDTANLATLGAEGFLDALAIQRDFVRHVHVKDAVLGNDGRRRSVVPGEGDDPWPALLAELVRGSYHGDLSIEYERRWLPHRPPADLALPKAKAFIERCLGRASCRAADPQ